MAWNDAAPWAKLCERQEGISDVEVLADPTSDQFKCSHCTGFPWGPLQLAHHLDGHLENGDRVPQSVLTYVAERCYDWIGRRLRVRD